MSNPKIDKNGTKRWFNQQGLLHREDGPAVECANRDKEWWQHGKLHRVDGPAVEDDYGTKYWYRYGKRHRKDGPAVEEVTGYKEWWVNDKKINVNSQEDFKRYMKLKAFW